MEQNNIDIRLTHEVLSLDICSAFVEADDVGGIVSFVGTVRNQTKGKIVKKLVFEAYEPMAISEMRKIAEHVLLRFEIKKIAIHHRTGTLNVGEVPVIITASSAHRKAAFEACQFAIDILKETVPIWKKEVFEDGEVWVSATP
jgi:molybdopterin synthase catalytic subunit